MKKSISIIIFFLLSTNIIAKDLKIGTVNIPTVMDRAPQIDNFREKIAELIKPEELELEKLFKQLQEKKNFYDKSKNIISASKARNLERQISNLEKNIQRKRSDISENVDIQKNEALKEIQILINESIRNIGSEEKYDLIMYEGIAYASSSTNITEKVIDQLKKMENER